MRLVGAIKASWCPQDPDRHSPSSCVCYSLGEEGTCASIATWFTVDEREQSSCVTLTCELCVVGPADVQGQGSML